MPVYRYVWNTIDLQDLQAQVPGVPTPGSTGPVLYVDVNAPDTSKDDLDLYMASKGYSFFDGDPAPTPREQFISTMSLVLTTDPRLGALPPYHYAVTETSSTTTSSTMQTKVTLDLGAVTGTYRIGFNCELATGTSNTRSRCRLYNVTNAVELCFSETRDSSTGIYHTHTGFALVTMAGAG
ncbi:MAG: hypothetical protein WC322_03110 [Candidatus Paceibacterota bacterium]|jgi:hypothetical protein